jgi:hypothetical protein
LSDTKAKIEEPKEEKKVEVKPKVEEKPKAEQKVVEQSNVEKPKDKTP